MNRLLAATILVFIGVSVLRAELETTTNAPPSVIVLEGMIRSISPPVVWPDSNRHILEIPEFVASNGIPSDVFAATFA